MFLQQPKKGEWALSIHDCMQVERLPDGLCDLTSLRVLNLSMSAPTAEKNANPGTALRYLFGVASVTTAADDGQGPAAHGVGGGGTGTLRELSSAG